MNTACETCPKRHTCRLNSLEPVTLAELDVIRLEMLLLGLSLSVPLAKIRAETEAILGPIEELIRSEMH